MKIVFTESGWRDYLWFQEHNRQLIKRINDLIRDAQRSPFRGLGKPEPLKGELPPDIGHDGSTLSIAEVAGDIVERVDPIFFSDPTTAAMKALGMT